MTKSDWEELYKKLELKRVHSKFNRAHRDANEGSNKEIRREGKSNLTDIISLITNLVRPYDEAFQLLAARGSDPLRNPYEMGEFLDQIKSKIDSF